MNNNHIERKIIELDDRRCRAMLAQDLATLERIFAPELVFIHSTNGAIDTKNSYLELFKTNAIDYKKIDLEDRQITVFDRTVILTGIARMLAFFKGKDREINIRFASVWIERENNWQIVLFSATSLAY